MSKRNFWISISILSLFVNTLLGVSCSKEPTAEEDQVIKIGAILPLTGPGAIFAQYIKEGLELALEEVNTSEKFNFQIIYEDSKNQPKEALSTYNRLVTTEQVPVVIVALSSVARALAPLANSTETVQMGIAVAIPGITDISEYVFRIYPEAQGMAGIMARYATTELNMETAGVIYINDDFGRSSYDVFKEVFENYGGEVVYSESYEITQSDFRNQITKLKPLSPDCIYLNGYGIAYGIIVKQLSELNVTSQLIADMTMGLPNTLEQAGNAAEGVFFVDGNMSDEFATKFRSKYNNEPTSYAGYAYDIVNLLRNIARESPEQYSAEFFRNSLLKIHGFPGAMGVISILPNGESTLQFVVKRIKEGHSVIVRTDQE